MLKSISNNIDDFIQKLHVLPVTQLYKLDPILSDLTNHIYEIDKHIVELKEKMKNFDQKQLQKLLIEANTLDKNLHTLHKLIYKMGYESHYMDRIQSILGTTFDELKELLIELRKIQT